MVRLAAFSVALCLSVCSGHRMTLKSHNNGIQEVCPESATINTKSDCIDDKTNEIVPMTCCACSTETTDALMRYNERIAVYMGQCGVKRNDVAQDEKFTVIDNKRICASRCQSIGELSDTLSTSALRDACRHDPRYEQLRMLVTLSESLDTAWSSCSESPSGPTTEMTTLPPTTTTTTDSGLFEPITDDELKSVFVIDVSGSMDHKTGQAIYSPEHACNNNATRIDIMKNELIQIIDGLSEEHSFAIVAFKTTGFLFFGSPKIEVLSPEFLTATAESKRRAVEWINDLSPGGRTPIKRGLEKAMSFEGADGIHLLTDGVPTDCRDAKDCLDICPAEGDCKIPPIHATLFMPGESEEETARPRAFLTGIANETQGRFREPFPPTTPTTTTTGLWESLPGELWDSLPTDEQGIAFVIDLSDSMHKAICMKNNSEWDILDDPTEHREGERCTTYFGLMKNELVSSIELLRPDQTFTIVGYSNAHEAMPRFSDEPIPASDANKARAATWLNNAMSLGHGKRDIAVALEHAVNMPGVDAVYLLSSGMPADDACTQVCCMMFDKVPIHTSLFMPGQEKNDERRNAKTLLKNVATQSGGIFTEPYALDSGIPLAIPLLLAALILFR